MQGTLYGCDFSYGDRNCGNWLIFNRGGRHSATSRNNSTKRRACRLRAIKIILVKMGSVGGFLFLLAGAAARISTQIGQLAGWPRLLADSFRICIPGFNKRFAWKTQFRFFLLFFLCTNVLIVFVFNEKPVSLIQLSAILDGLLLTPLQAIWVAIGLFVVMPRLLSKEASQVLKPNWIFAFWLIVAFLVFGYFCIFQIPSVISAIFTGGS